MLNKTCTYLIVVVIALICNASTAMADSTGLVKFNLDNGLPSNHVYRTYQDRNGYMWFATDNGVVKYDGYSFKIFNTSTGLPSSDVWLLYEDGLDRVWLGTYAYELGYIKNDKYYRTNYKSNELFKLEHFTHKGQVTYLMDAKGDIFILDSTNIATIFEKPGQMSSPTFFSPPPCLPDF